MIKKEVFIGFLIGISANALGLLIAVLIFGNDGNIQSSVKQSIENDFFGKLVSIGAILNLMVFFWFIKKKQDYRARGVILATIAVAVITFLINLK
ncbi:MAG TPA: hypothetical protein PKL92_05030 [Aquaticitalea sp.]|nr:hypothetical protein [Aquaticitalea sp.]